MNEWFESNLPPLILAMMGGIADFLMSDEHSWTSIFISIFLAGFAGYLVLLVCIEYNLSDSMTGVTCGIAGMSSKAVLALFKHSVISKLSVYFKVKKDGEG